MDPKFFRKYSDLVEGRVDDAHDKQKINRADPTHPNWFSDKDKTPKSTSRYVPAKKYGADYKDPEAGELDEGTDKEIYHKMRRLAATAQDVVNTARSLLAASAQGDSRFGLFDAAELDEYIARLEHIDSELMR